MFGGMCFTVTLYTHTHFNAWTRSSSLTVMPTPRRSLPNITTVCPTTPPDSEGYQSHLSHMSDRIEEFCFLRHLQKTTFVPAIYTFPPWPGVRSLYPNKGEQYPFPESGVRFAISFSHDKTLEGNCENGWPFDSTTCVEGLKKEWEGSCNVTRSMPDPATLHSMATTSHQSPHSNATSKRDGTVNLPSSECVSFHLSSPPSTTTADPSTLSPADSKTEQRPKQKSLHLDRVFTDSSHFSLDGEAIVCNPERKDLEKDEKGWCVCWYQGLEGQRRRFWPANGDMMCWNLMPWVWRPSVGKGEG